MNIFLNLYFGGDDVYFAAILRSILAMTGQFQTSIDKMVWLS